MKESTITPLIPDRGSIVAFLAMRARLTDLPAATWPLEASFEILVHSAPPAGRISALLDDLADAQTLPDIRVPGIAALVRRLTAEGRLKARGSGWDAALDIDVQWLLGHERLFDLLPDDDQRAIDDAAQRLVAMTTILSKKVAA